MSAVLYFGQSPDRKEARFVITDTGIGISAENRKHVFDRFFKVNDFIQGTGLGLSICKAFADACHGDIGVISEGKGTGSVFWMWIPC